jgi:hypothetical protein
LLEHLQLTVIMKGLTVAQGEVGIAGIASSGRRGVEVVGADFGHGGPIPPAG